MGLGAPENWKDVWLDDHTYQDEWGVVRTMPPGALYYDLIRGPPSPRRPPSPPSSGTLGPIPTTLAATEAFGKGPVTSAERQTTPSSWT
jgi:hypothetical protein